MLNFKVIGAGAAGNKAAIQLLKSGFNENDVVLVNSTSKDIQEEYKDKSMIFGTGSETLGGCGKERNIGKQLILSDMRSMSISFDGLCDPDTNAVIIVSSTEGGSGSAVTPIIAKYVKEVLGMPVIVCLFFGFNTDVRGMQNSIEICQELSDDYGIIGISNSKFMDAANGNQRKAEQLANEEFVRLVSILSGTSITPSEQNIDATDLYKLVTTPGYMRIESTSLQKIKNVEQFNKAVTAAIDESPLMDCTEYGAKRIGLIFDISEPIADNVDYSAATIKGVYGTPYEMFTHVQHTDRPDRLTWIVTGLMLPLDEVKEIYQKYIDASSSVNKRKDSFFTAVSEMKGNQEDGMFNMLGTKKAADAKAKASFFADFGLTQPSEPKDKGPGKPVVKTKPSDTTEEY